MIVVKLDLIVEDLCLHRFIVKLWRETVLVGINAHKAGLADPECFIAEHIVRHFWKRKQLGAFFLPKALYRGVTLVMLPLSVLLTPFQKMLVKFIKAEDRGDRNKGITPDVAYLVLDVALFVAGRRIAEISLKAVILRMLSSVLSALSAAYKGFRISFLLNMSLLSIVTKAAFSTSFLHQKPPDSVWTISQRMHLSTPRFWMPA